MYRRLQFPNNGFANNMREVDEPAKKTVLISGSFNGTTSKLNPKSFVSNVQLLKPRNNHALLQTFCCTTYTSMDRLPDQTFSIF